jgi:tRNA A-37 threonylcarbamoyl transferase component Bud32
VRATNAIHPSPDQLSAFALGKLSDADIATVSEHVAECAACRAAAGAATDSFIDLLRAVQAATAAGGADQTSSADASGRPDPHAEQIALPAELCDHPRYRFVRFLGQGGMGAVYLAEHKVLKQPRAVKVIKPALIGAPRAVERFAKEIELLAKLHHAHIVQAYDAEQAGDLHFLVMEYVEGETLAAVLKQRGPLPVELACDYVRQAALGLQYAHEQALVHRDLKPANLLLTREGSVKILDFGLGRLASESCGSPPALTDEHVLMGTPDYMAPEQILGAHAVDARADIYSLGCSLFCLLAGRPPFHGATGMEVALAHLQHTLPSLREIRPDVPAELSGFVERMLAKKPEQRQQTASEVVQGLASFIHHAAARTDTVSTTDTTSGEQEPSAPLTEAGRPLPKSAPASIAARPLLRHRLLWAGVALALLAVSGLALWGTVLRVRTADGTIVLEQVPEGAEVFVDGERLTLKPRGQNEPVTIRVEPGRHRLEIKKEGFRVFSRELALDAGGREPVIVRLEPTGPAAALTNKRPLEEPGEFVSLFNGKDTTGWIPQNAAIWTVEHGILVGRGGLGMLLHQRMDFANFHLRVETMLSEGQWHALHFRRRREESGYAVKIGGAADADEDRKTGSLSQAGRKTGKLLAEAPDLPLKPGEWFTLEVIAVGNSFTVLVNGKQILECTDPDNRSTVGGVGLLHRNLSGVIRYRKIEIKELPPAK